MTTDIRSFRRSPRHSFRTAFLLLSAITLPLSAAWAKGLNRGVESIHQPVVQRNDYVLDVSGNGLSPVESANIQRCFDAIGLDYGDRVSIDGSAGANISNPDIGAIIGRYGLFVSEGAPITQGAIPAGYVRIIVSRSTATVPDCPDYSKPSQPNFTGAASSNYGCGINSTLAAMVANPEDLVNPRPGRNLTSDTASKAIRAWRTAEPTSKNGLKAESTQGGK